MKIVYRSKVDAWLIAVLGSAVAVSIYTAITVLSDPTPTNWAVALFTAAVGAGLPVWLLFSTRYTLDKGQLTVQSGPFKWRIPVAEIRNITPTSNPLASPALSLRRLRIDYGRGKSLMISPSNKEQFLQDIAAASRHAV